MTLQLAVPRKAAPALIARRLARRVRRGVNAWILPVLVGLTLSPTLLLELAARAGYAARGFLYVSMGLIALLAAAGLRRSAEDGRGSLIAMVDGPLVFFWLSAVGVALTGFAFWRAAQVVLDADRQGTRLRALLSRAGQAISGLVYAALALSVFDLLDAVEDHGPDEARRQAAEVLAWPGGEWVLIGAGLFIVGCGVGNIVQAVLTDFGRKLGCSEHTRRWADGLGRIGHAARGVAFIPLGLFLVEAGLDLDPSQARDFGQAIQSLEAQPYGSWVMGLTAMGLVAFGLFALIEARYRRITIPG